MWVRTDAGGLDSYGDTGWFSTGSQHETEMESAEQRSTENPESGEHAIERSEVMIPETEMHESVDDRTRI